ncbi:MAG: HAMP domain-containing sensor histidine kinase [Candidatus Gracilibacteria bacterium]
MEKTQNLSLQGTHYRLTILATLCAFVATSMIGGGFIGAKYLNEYRLSRDAFDRESQVIGAMFQRIGSPHNMEKPSIRRSIHDATPPPRESIGIIKFSSGIIVSIDIPERLLSSKLEGSITNFQNKLHTGNYLQEGNITNMEEQEGYFFRIFTRGDDSLLLLSRSAYDKDDLMSDILYFLLVNFIFILPFAIISSSLIRRILKPIRKNINEMEAFIHDAGHELKTPLAIANGNLQLLSKTYQENEEIHQAQKAIKHADNLITTLVELSSIERAPKNTICNLKDILLEEMGSLEARMKEKSLTINIDKIENISHIIAQEHAKILMHNLIENAIKYNNTGGEIFVELTEKSLIIRDTGVGITKEHQSKIFDRFYRINHSQQNGHGIGLALVAKICSIYKMKIIVESQEGQGSTFKILF